MATLLSKKMSLVKSFTKRLDEVEREGHPKYEQWNIL